MKTSSDILQHYRKTSILGSALEIMSWDMETNLPAAAGPLRGEQLGLLSELHHREMTRPDFIEAVLSLEPKKLETEDRKQMERLREEILLSRMVDGNFVSKREEARVRCQNIWKDAKKKKNFALVADALNELVLINQEWADRAKNEPELKAKYGTKSRYEVHMDQFEPGMPADDLRGVLAELGEGTKKILPEIIEVQKKNRASSSAAFAMKVDKQRELVRQLATRIGFDFQRGRLDVSTHPFCGGTPGDVRMTTRFDESDFTEAVYGVVHETGHALYEQGLPEKFLRTPCGRAVSLGVHESQSRFMENQIGRSPAFCDFLSKLTRVPGAKVLAHVHQVAKSHIRVEADEVTYNLHILLRMRIEEDLINGKLKTKDLPERWNADFQELFGLKVPNDGVGCLQDIHWYGGAFGYFPTYSLGNLIASELFALYTKEFPRWKTSVKAGQFGDTKKFLNERVHKLAAFDDSPHSLEKMIGKRLPDPKVFLDYLRTRYISEA